MGQLAIVNAPSTFTAIWAIMKPWLSKETAEKVDILGSNYKDVLLNLVDADCLPSTLGGTCECKDQGGCHLSGAGPWMDGRVGWGKPNNPLSDENLNQPVIEKDAAEAEVRQSENSVQNLPLGAEPGLATVESEQK